MSVIAINGPEQQSEAMHWARLIPGQSRALREHTKKIDRTVVKRIGPPDNPRMKTQHIAGTQSRLSLLKPCPLESRSADKWIRSMGTDCALVTLNWLILGAALVPLRELFPQVWSFRYAAGTPIYLLGMAMLHAALITLIGYSEGLHIRSNGLRRQIKILVKSITWSTVLLCAAYSLQGQPWTISALICMAGILHFSALCAWRWGARGDCSKRTEQRNVLIIGAASTGQRLANSIAEHPASGRNVCGFLDDEVGLGGPVIGQVSDLAQIARRQFVDEIIVAGPHDRTRTRWVLEQARRLQLDIQIVPEFLGCNSPRDEIETIGDLPVICVHAERVPTFSLFLKRTIDVVVAAATLVALSPMLTFIACLIKLDSSGPIFYCAPRAGKKGHLFRCFKFRTMVSNADELKPHLQQDNQRSGPFFKITSDPRITRIGLYLRRYSFDELPQLWNVLRGEMSLVGPRPHPLDDIAGYEIEHLGRLDVTPGITGLWQVTARQDPSFERGMELDREYIRTWSLKLDAKILVKTIWAVIMGSGE